VELARLCPSTAADLWGRDDLPENQLKKDIWRSRDEHAFSTNAWNDVCKQYSKLIAAVVSWRLS
jgi:hypothetical protein